MSNSSISKAYEISNSSISKSYACFGMYLNEDHGKSTHDYRIMCALNFPTTWCTGIAKQMRDASINTRLTTSKLGHITSVVMRIVQPLKHKF